MSPSDKREEREIVRRLDGILPEGINRRNFLTAAGTTLFGGALAGCTGDGGDGGTPTDSGSDGPDKLIQSVVWRQPWKVEPTWAMAQLAEHDEYWSDRNIAPPNVQRGFGSVDTARRIGTGGEEMGIASFGSSIPGLAQGYNMNLAGVVLQKSQVGLMWRDDKMDAPDDLEGKFVTLGVSRFAETTWPVWLQVTGTDPSVVDSKFHGQGVAPNVLAEGEADALWGSMDVIGAYRQAMPEGVELIGTPLNSVANVYGHSIWVNSDWLGESNNQEYFTRAVEGYSHACKWAMLNPEAYLDILLEEINPAQQAQDEETLLTQIQVTAATRIGEEVRDNGYTWFSNDRISTSLDAYKVLAENQSDVPTTDELVDRTAIENADLATFSSDEFNQIKETAGDFWDIWR